MQSLCIGIADGETPHVSASNRPASQSNRVGLLRPPDHRIAIVEVVVLTHYALLECERPRKASIATWTAFQDTKHSAEKMVLHRIPGKAARILRKK